MRAAWVPASKAAAPAQLQGVFPVEELGSQSPFKVVNFLFYEKGRRRGRPFASRVMPYLVPEDLFLHVFGVFRWRRGHQSSQRDDIIRRRFFFQDVLAIQPLHASILLFLFGFGRPRPQLLFAGVLGDAEVVKIVLDTGANVLIIQLQLMLRAGEVHLLAAGKDLVAPVL